VARPLGDHREEKEAKLAVIEGPAASAAAVRPVALATAVRMIGEIIGRGEMMTGAILVSSFHELPSAVVPTATPAAFTAVAMIGKGIGLGEMMARAISVSVFHDFRYISRYI
jgi:hypothetical protein